MIEIGIFIAGVLFGAGLVRYGMGLGFKAICQAKEDSTLGGESSSPIEQSYTEDEELPISQAETEDL